MRRRHSLITDTFRKKPMNFKTVLLTSGLMLCAGAADAALVEYSASLPTQPSPFSTTFSVPLFNSALGTLNGVTLSLVSNIVGQIDVFSILSTAQTFTNAFAQIPVTVTGPDGTSLTAVATAMLASGSATPNFQISSFPGIAATAQASVSLVPASFGSYLGQGGATALFTAFSEGGNFGGTSVPGLFFGGSATSDASLSIRYDYDPVSAVPVPAAAWLLGTGLLSLGAFCRRKRRATA